MNELSIFNKDRIGIIVCSFCLWLQYGSCAMGTDLVIICILRTFCSLQIFVLVVLNEILKLKYYPPDPVPPKIFY